jgi:hypothetical protein
MKVSKLGNDAAFAVLLLLVTLVAASVDHSMPVLSVAKDGQFARVSYWDKSFARIRLEAACDDSSRTCAIRAYRSYGLPAWLDPVRQETVRLPAGKEGYGLTIPNPDYTGSKE